MVRVGWVQCDVWSWWRPRPFETCFRDNRCPVTLVDLFDEADASMYALNISSKLDDDKMKPWFDKVNTDQDTLVTSEEFKNWTIQAIINTLPKGELRSYELLNHKTFTRCGELYWANELYIVEAVSNSSISRLLSDIIQAVRYQRQWSFRYKEQLSCSFNYF